jgi:hypothetical protein
MGERMMSIGEAILSSPEILAIMESHVPGFRERLSSSMNMSEEERI